MTNQQPTPRKTVVSRGKIGAGLVAIALVAGGIFTAQAVADSRTYRHIAAEAGYVDVHLRGHKRFSDLTDAEIEERVTRVVRHIAIEIDATDDQQKRIVALVTAVASEMKPLRATLMANRDEVRELLLSDTIDRAAMEEMRAARIAEIDQLSKNVVAAVADAAEVLTPEQRRTLEERIREFRGAFGGRGRHGGWRH